MKRGGSATRVRDRVITKAAVIGFAAAIMMTGCEATSKPEAIDLNKYESVYSNPFPQLEEEWDDYGNGDPFVMRHDGSYYLYVSTKDHRVGIKAWKSEDLVNWSYAGLVTEDPVSTGAYAPEVTYWNGYFYLYTSPAGRGHYVFRSESPTGPFERITENLGMSIDGSVFIDDDGSWTFTHAGTEGIVGVPMNDPAAFGFGAPIPGTFLGHWTEGSMIIKRGGKYYMTFTGNHVFSKGYRIAYAVSDESPTGPYKVPDNNPIVISTKPDFFGLGHSSTVMGPDLDSHYLVYHNLVGRSAEGPPVRQMNIDRLVFNGDIMDAVGPTNYEQPYPGRPAFEGRPSAGLGEWERTESEEGLRILSPGSSEADFTAEFNVRGLAADTKVAAIFSHADESNYGMAEISQSERKLRLVAVHEGTETIMAEAGLPDDTDFSKLHTIRVENGVGVTRVYFDGLNKIEQQDSDFGGGRIGYRHSGGEPELSYTAFSNLVGGSSDFETTKALPGTIEAVHYLRGESRGFSVKERSSASEWRQADGTDLRLASDGAYAIRLNSDGDWLRYIVNVSEAGTYGLDLTVAAGTDKRKLELLVDDETAATFTISADEEAAGESEWVKVHAGNVKLEAGIHTVTLKAKSGGLELKRLAFRAVDDTRFSEERVLQDAASDQIHGLWDSTDSEYAGVSFSDAKLYGGSERWSDYRIETSVKLGPEASGAAGVLFRVTNESDFPDQVTDSLMGYFLAVTPSKLELHKLNYDSTMVAAEKIKLPRGSSEKLAIEAVGGKIQVYIGDEKEPVLTYDDPDAFMQGKVGLRSNNASDMTLGDLNVTSIQ
ncbi:family 43 glycosylhydrolase [Paenibacillus soyae]|uniref:Family 43 glycosylhydrolase n=1 Tax=Paenibacillus soyae TaxID=2969249 RepID=A0A9X2MU47_9BACL|nr:family 43 glycosylhydrolase [Paenibacillus soyae]MCR2803832.1 family 43 glycosylhydrolase [Paenibacillus soyae]